ncbi:hypothetical protein CBR_g48266 [Chara braunii]|uniref:Uncharacterized protein n=1 Tax=Chara braunii TaxID=69332 RepID=A0A388M2H2_CHABU|nr:hypothetical protein CBR_g48266 [Chara braunii]|eukprot:GBG88736.1 hypothetical protein CBR_g48266 [Chara braunii]
MGGPTVRLAATADGCAEVAQAVVGVVHVCFPLSAGGERRTEEERREEERDGDAEDSLRCAQEDDREHDGQDDERDEVKDEDEWRLSFPVRCEVQQAKARCER